MGISNEKSPKWVLLQHLKAQNKNFLQEVKTKAKLKLQVVDPRGFWRFKRGTSLIREAIWEVRQD